MIVPSFLNFLCILFVEGFCIFGKVERMTKSKDFHESCKTNSTHFPSHETETQKSNFIFSWIPTSFRAQISLESTLTELINNFKGRLFGRENSDVFIWLDSSFYFSNINLIKEIHNFQDKTY